MAHIYKLDLYRSAKRLNGASQETFNVASEVRGFTRVLSSLEQKLRQTEDLVSDAGQHLEVVQDGIVRFQDRYDVARAALDKGDIAGMVEARNRLMMRRQRI